MGKIVIKTCIFLLVENLIFAILNLVVTIGRQLYIAANKVPLVLCDIVTKNIVNYLLLQID